MSWSDMLDRELGRVRIALILMAVAFLFLGSVIWRIQVIGSGRYIDSMERQSMRRVRLPGTRGRILDRNGVCLADNRPNYCIAVYVEELRKPGKWARTVDAVEQVIDELAATLRQERLVTREDIGRHIRKRLALPFLAWNDIGPEALARWAESRTELAGGDVYVEPVRRYPHGFLAAHVLGHVGRADPEQDADEPYHFYLPDMAGAAGVEKIMDDVLTGIPGGRLIRVDASGYKHGVIGERRPEPGRDVWLTLDVGIQRLAEEMLEGQRGAVVVLDPSNGDVLALASAPSFDPNIFSPGFSSDEWNSLRNDSAQPLLNRAVAGIYPPGSTFKPVVAIASIVNRRASSGTAFDCPGYFALGNARFDCWRKRGHGRLVMRKALEQSCNAYFCQLGLQCGYERIFRMAQAMGFGHRTGIELPYESAGILPSDQWKRKRFHDAWRPGDTCNVSIGQGALAVTPLQMAVLTAAIANGGRIYKPRLLQGGEGPEGELVNDLGWNRKELAEVRNGMYDVIQSDTGTGKRARIAAVEFAGKTGTAEYGPSEAGKKHAWMLAFAPYKRPRYAVAVVIEDAVSGGISAAPRIRKLMEGIFGGGETAPAATGEDEG